MIEILNHPDQPAWDKYAACKSKVIFSHRFAWGESFAAAGWLPIFLLAAVDADFQERSHAGNSKVFDSLLSHADLCRGGRCRYAGWWQGVDGSANNEPFRNSIDLSSVPSTAGTRTLRAVGRSNSTRTRNHASSAI